MIRGIKGTKFNNYIHYIVFICFHSNKTLKLSLTTLFNFLYQKIILILSLNCYNHQKIHGLIETS